MERNKKLGTGGNSCVTFQCGMWSVRLSLCISLKLVEASPPMALFCLQLIKCRLKVHLIGKKKKYKLPTHDCRSWTSSFDWVYGLHEWDKTIDQLNASIDSELCVCLMEIDQRVAETKKAKNTIMTKLNQWLHLFTVFPTHAVTVAFSMNDHE